ncbi:hypothetical protein H8K38_17530 [Undibacterium sp. FT79W]|uniref:hypothetical protein n=1 Tax=Undibacterium sp. FT79W TaxID=2762296 RepID=UPI00164AF8D1|nr:hypothetical protein [Undibacterium sp. FT79W]MBC3879614.1 hypothetical protein [Undibacterium sp. FT79W]
MDNLWNQEVTKQLIFDIYGKDQMLLARDSLVSVVERADFASFHIHEVTLRWDQHIGEVRDLKMGEVLAPTCDDRKTRYASRFHEIGAHVQACVQSLHSFPDILSHALYYGLALDKKFKLNERDISHKAVAKKACAGPITRGPP